jgi:hypothetical protein
VIVYPLPNVAIGMRQVVTAMRQIGYRARLKVDNNPNYFGYVADSRHRVHAAFFGWVAGDNSASGFFVGGCSTARRSSRPAPTAGTRPGSATHQSTG